MRPIARRNPPSPWESTHVEYLGEPPALPLEVFEDETKSILSRNDSPDLGFRFSVNPYRGCYHGCAYCYARPTHEYLGFGAGADFERKIVVKKRAPELLRAAFARRSWKRETVVFSGNTDCYQPLEATYRLTRGCLEVCLEHGNPVHVITKAPLIERDTDVLSALAEQGLVGVTLSVPFFTAETARSMEPGVATPERRMLTVARLSAASVPTSVNVAPVIPGLSDRDIPRILEAAARAGAVSAGMVMLRLPGNVKAVFEERLRAEFPLSAEKVLARTREVRGGALNDPKFGSRMRGEGEYADTVLRLFEATARRLGLYRDPARIEQEPEGRYLRTSVPETGPSAGAARVRPRAGEAERAAEEPPRQLTLLGIR